MQQDLCRSSRRRAGSAALLAVLLLLAACALTARPGEELAAAAADYAQRLRWLDYPGLAVYLPAEHREAFRERFVALEDLRIVDVRLEAVDYREGEGRGETLTLVEYYLLPSVTVKKSRLRQEWLYTAGDRLRPGGWRLAGAFPPFP